MATEKTCFGNNTLSLNFSTSLVLQFYTPHEWIVQYVIFPICLVFGVTSNLMFLYVITMVPKMRTVTNFYLGNLAVADIMYLVAACVQSNMQYSTSSVRFTTHSSNVVLGCVLPYSVTILCYFTSISLVTLVTIERYLATCHPIIKHYIVRDWRQRVYLTPLDMGCGCDSLGSVWPISFGRSRNSASQRLAERLHRSFRLAP